MSDKLETWNSGVKCEKVTGEGAEEQRLALLQELEQVFLREAALFEDAEQCASGEFLVKRNDSLAPFSPQTEMTALLAKDLKSTFP